MTRLAVRVGVVVDRADRMRGQFWHEAVCALRESHDVTCGDPILLPVADSITRPLNAEPMPLEVISSDIDILVINWDAINGDPDFGADLARNWIAHRRTALR